MLVNRREEPSAWREKSVVRMLEEEIVRTRLKTFRSQAVSSPPEAPTESTETKERRAGGRKEAALEEVTWPSLVSCRPRIVGRAARTSARTAEHLLSSPRPRTFQEQTMK
jgi:hypothetical protein